MPVFAILGVTAKDKTALKEAVEASFPGEDHIEITEDTYFVSADTSSSRKAFTQLAASEELQAKIGTFFVIRFSDYWGLAAPSVWEWLASKRNAVRDSEST